MQNNSQAASTGGMGQVGQLLELLSKIKSPNGGIKGLSPATPDHAFEATARMLLIILPAEIRLAGMIPQTDGTLSIDHCPHEALLLKATMFILEQQLGHDRLAGIDQHLWQDAIIQVTRGLTAIKNLLGKSNAND